jgi:ketosteroid isomerase-like protein
MESSTFGRSRDTARAMSEENVEVVQRLFGRVVSNHEFPPELVTTDFTLDVSEVSPEVGVAHGVKAAEEALRPYWDTFDHFHTAVEEVINADGDRVVIALRDVGRIKGSDAEVSSHYFHVYTFRDGKIARQSIHADRERALKAAGLAE